MRLWGWGRTRCFPSYVMQSPAGTTTPWGRDWFGGKVGEWMRDLQITEYGVQVPARLGLRRGLQA
ncbi:hypothetical protein ABIA39_005716 [Nocardia sp. GAS34]|jgi:hypothetical protein